MVKFVNVKKNSSSSVIMGKEQEDWSGSQKCYLVEASFCCCLRCG